MFVSRTRDRITIENGEHRSFDLSNPSQRRQAYDSQQQLRAEVRPPRLTIDWDQLRELVRRYPRFEVGVRTVDHVALAARGPGVARSQLFSCVAEAQCELDRPVWHFSFPYGRYTSQTKRVVEEVGLRSAEAGGNNCLINKRTDVFAMPRIDPRDSMTLFRFWTSGAYPGQVSDTCSESLESVTAALLSRPDGTGRHALGTQRDRTEKHDDACT